MPSYQRRRGRIAKFWPVTENEDQRGNRVLSADTTTEPYVRRAAEFSERSSRAEVPGQQQINVVRLIVDHEMPGVGLWSLCEWEGEMWDVIAPVAYHHGTRQVRHWSVMIRRRPINEEVL